MDIFSSEKRSDIMSRVRSRDTKPELRLRSRLHGHGLRYVIHDRRLPGSPDVSFPSRRLAIFVHGCFWHGHSGCKKASMPATRSQFWSAKIERNKLRDERVRSELTALGWAVRVVWECSITTESLDALAREIKMIPAADRPKLNRRSRRRAPRGPRH